MRDVLQIEAARTLSYSCGTEASAGAVGCARVKRGAWERGGGSAGYVIDCMGVISGGKVPKKAMSYLASVEERQG